MLSASSARPPVIAALDSKIHLLKTQTLAIVRKEDVGTGWLAKANLAPIGVTHCSLASKASQKEAHHGPADKTTANNIQEQQRGNGEERKQRKDV